MKHKVKVQVPVEKRGLFGIKKTVMETRTIEVDSKTYKKMQQEKKNPPSCRSSRSLPQTLSGDA